MVGRLVFVKRFRGDRSGDPLAGFMGADLRRQPDALDDLERQTIFTDNLQHHTGVRSRAIHANQRHPVRDEDS